MAEVYIRKERFNHKGLKVLSKKKVWMRSQKVLSKGKCLVRKGYIVNR